VKKSLPRYFNKKFCQRGSAFVVLPLGFYKLFSLPKGFFVNFCLSTGFRVEKTAFNASPIRIISFWRGSLVLNPAQAGFIKQKQLQFLPKILGEVNAFWAKSHYFGFYCIFINKFFENLSGKGPRGFCVITPYPLTPLV
jgi:hypothetical protein